MHVVPRGERARVRLPQPSPQPAREDEDAVASAGGRVRAVGRARARGRGRAHDVERGVGADRAPGARGRGGLARGEGRHRRGDSVLPRQRPLQLRAVLGAARGRRRGRAATGGVSRVMAAANHHRRLRASREGRERGRARERPRVRAARGRDDDGAIGDGAFGIPRGAFAGCVPCAPCQAAKPPGAHHCSTCRQCVQAMDHHCPFVANCVGADTMRHFLLFVGYVALGNLYGICLCFLATRERGGPAGGAVAAFLDALGSKQRFRHGWDDAAETTREGTGAVFGSKTLSRFLGPPPALRRRRFCEAGRREARSHSRYTARITPRVGSRAWSPRRSTRRRTGSGGGRGSSAPAGPSASRPRFCSGPRSEASPRARPSSRVSSANKRHPEASSRRVSEPAEPTTSVSKTRRSRARLETHALFKSLLNRLERACPPVVRDGFDCLTCGCVTGSAGPAPWSRIGAFHLRQVFGSGPVWAWGAPLAEPPAGARNGAGTNKKGK